MDETEKKIEEVFSENCLKQIKHREHLKIISKNVEKIIKCFDIVLEDFEICDFVGIFEMYQECVKDYKNYPLNLKKYIRALKNVLNFCFLFSLSLKQRKFSDEFPKDETKGELKHLAILLRDLLRRIKDLLNNTKNDRNSFDIFDME